MRKIVYLWTIILTTLCFASCGKEEMTPQPELVLSTEELTVGKDGETVSFYVKSNTDWTLSSSQAWCTVSPVSGEAGTTKIDAVIVNNETTSPRTALITINAGSLSKQVSITQSESFLLELGQTEYTVGTGGEQLEIEVESSEAYAVDISADWITLVEGNETGNPKFNVSVHPGLIDRSATITFSLQDLTRTVTITQAGNPLSIPADDTGMSSDAMVLAPMMKAGWNLGNSLEATGVSNGVFTAGETLWGNPATTKTLIDAVKAAGFNSVRIPCAWSGYIEDEETYKISDAWLNRVKEVVDYCIENDMYAIINIHWDGGWLEEHPLYSHQEDVNKKQKALWEQIAVAFRNYDEHLLFAGTNEVHANYGNPTAENIETQQSYNQTFINAVRSTGGKNAWRNLVVQGYNTNITHTINHMIMPSDPANNRMMAEVHFYDPWDFCGESTSNKFLWGAEFSGSPNVSSWGQEAWVDEAFGMMKTKFVDNGIPVILGEYGAILRTNLQGAAQQDHITARNNYLHYVTQAAKDNGLIPFYWDNGFTGDNAFGLFNRATGEKVHDDAISAITSVFN
jgi:endoglucanase